MKEERGSVTIITITTILFLISCLLSTYMIIANRRQSQEEIRRQTELLYENDVDNADEIYNSYFADENDTIPITKVEQLLQIGTNSYISSGDKIYKCTPNANYKLMANLSFDVEEYLEKYADAFSEQEYDEIQDIETSEVIKEKEGTKTTYEELSITQTGKYLLELWGANGGTYNSSYATGGTGGYSKGTVELEEGEVVYLYAGGAGTYGTDSGTTSTSGGGWNGGGDAGYRGGAGGGASDIRIGGTTLYYRLIVAGGRSEEQLLNQVLTMLLEAMVVARFGRRSVPIMVLYLLYQEKEEPNRQVDLGGEKGSSVYAGKSGSFGTGGNSPSKSSYSQLRSNGAGGGGWYGGGSASNYYGSKLIFTNVAGGGGGSGFVWSRGKERPKDYQVDEKYYLDDAATYSPTETGFISNPISTGNGYIKITLTSKKVGVQGTATRWKNIEYQTEQGTFTGTFDYNGKTITETDSDDNIVKHEASTNN